MMKIIKTTTMKIMITIMAIIIIMIMMMTMMMTLTTITTGRVCCQVTMIVTINVLVQ